MVFDVRYSTTNNFTKNIIYDNDKVLLRVSTAEKLLKVNKEVEKYGFRLKIYDGYRSIEAEKKLWSIVSDSRYVANPYKGGSIHNKGCAVDLTMVDKDGNEVKMPSGYDDFTTKAHRTSSMGEEEKRSLEILTNAMVKAGFKPIETEWWHYEDSDMDSYEKTEVNLDLFKK